MKYNAYRMTKAGYGLGNVHAAENDKQTLCGKEINERWHLVPNSEWRGVACLKCRRLAAKQEAQA